MTRRIRGFVLSLVVLAAAPGRADVLGLFIDTSVSDERVGVVDPATGAVTAFGEALDTGPRSGGVYDVDLDTGNLYFVAGTDSAPGTWSLWTIDLRSGAAVDFPPVTTPVNFDGSPSFLEFDPVGGRILGIVSRTTDNRRFLARFDPVTGDMTLIGTGFTTGGYSSGISAFDAAHQIFYLVANVFGGSDPALYRVNAATGAVIGSATLNTAIPELGLTPNFLAYDPASGKVLAIVNLSPNKVLVSIAPTTGALTALSAPMAATGYSSGVADFDEATGVFYFAANDATNTTSTLFRVEADGTVLPSHVFTSSDPDITPGPTFLVVPEPAGAALALSALASLLGISRARSHAGFLNNLTTK